VIRCSVQATADELDHGTLHLPPVEIQGSHSERFGAPTGPQMTVGTSNFPTNTVTVAIR
jgi:hypothetical protein